MSSDPNDKSRDGYLGAYEEREKALARIKDPLDIIVDITAPEHVQVQVREDGKVLWINVDGICVLRCCQIKSLILQDKLWVCT